MAEKDASVRLRRAVQGLDLVSFFVLFIVAHYFSLENNLFLVKRLIKRTEMRNPDPNTKRYTSLAWAAVCGHKETFEYLLSQGHDDDELSKVCPFFPYCTDHHRSVPQDSDDNTILILLADAQPPATANSFRSGSNDYYSIDAIFRMARSYYDKYPDIRDWANSQGKTALHVAAIKGNEELVRVSFFFQSRRMIVRLLTFFRCSSNLAPILICLIIQGIPPCISKLILTCIIRS
jgi:uncharacterized protein